MKKRFLALFAALIFVLAAFAAGCDSGTADKSDGTEGGTEQGTEGSGSADKSDGSEGGSSEGSGSEGGTEEDDEKEDTEVERPLRVLPPDFKYKVSSRNMTVNYTDSEGREISLFGKIWEPDDFGIYPAVIMSHGFNGHYSDFPAECQAFAERGYICYAFGFCGAQAGGKSTGRTAAEYTPFTMKEDLRAAIAKVGSIGYVDKTQIFLFGGSQGGFITALTAADEDLKDQIAGLAMYFPALNIPDDWRGKPEVDSYPFPDFPIGAGYIHSVQDLDPFEVIGNFEKDVCIVWGTADTLVARKYIDNAVAAYGAERVDLTVLEGAGHGFVGTAAQTAVKTVLAFLEAHTYEYKKK